MRRILALAGIALLVLVLLHRRRPADRRDELTFVAEDDSAMTAAIGKARHTVSTFVQHLEHPTATQTFASVKLPLTEGDAVEHVWISNVRFAGGRFHGRIDNDVQSIPRWKHGDTVSVPADSISDWLVIDDSVALGGYSIRALRAKMSPRERAEMDAASPYRFAEDSAASR
jgi:uncharacterized protein YegJ (DUF2314 family)